MLHRHRSVSVLSASNVCPRGYSLCELPLPFCCRMPLCIAEYHGSARRVLVAERPARDARVTRKRAQGRGARRMQRWMARMAALPAALSGAPDDRCPCVGGPAKAVASSGVCVAVWPSVCCCCCARPHAFACATCPLMAPAPSHSCSSMRKCRLVINASGRSVPYCYNGP